MEKYFIKLPLQLKTSAPGGRALALLYRLAMWEGAAAGVLRELVHIFLGGRPPQQGDRGGTRSLRPAWSGVLFDQDIGETGDRLGSSWIKPRRGNK